MTFVIVTALLLFFFTRKYIKKLHKEVNERKAFENKLRQEKNLLHSITDTVPVGITILNREGSINFANAFAEKLFGLSKNKITTRTYDSPQWKIADVNGKPFPESELPFSQVKRKAEPVFNVEHTLHLRDGTKKILSINAAPLFDKQGNFDSAVSGIMDITKLKEFQSNLQKITRTYAVLSNINQVIVRKKDIRKIF